MKGCKITPVQSAAKEVTLGCGYVTGRNGRVQEAGGGGCSLKVMVELKFDTKEKDRQVKM